MIVATGEGSPKSPVVVPAATSDLFDEVIALAHDLPGGLRRLVVRTGDRSVEVEWTADGGPGTTAAGAAVLSGGTPPVAGTPAAASAEPAVEVPGDVTAVRAPLVGTFYASPSPEAAPFVRLGDTVDAGQTVGIVEAMKLMNPIVVEEAGVVAEILVGDAESVEYDQVLMLIRPADAAQ